MNVRSAIAGGIRWWAFFLIAFFVVFGLLGSHLVDGLRFVLEGLSHFGEGWR